MKAFCYANGVIRFGQRCGNGSIEIARSAGNSKAIIKRFKADIEVTARHAYDGKTLLVPGVPEAANQTEGCDALIAYCKWLRTRYLSHPNPCGSVNYRGK